MLKINITKYSNYSKTKIHIPISHDNKLWRTRFVQMRTEHTSHNIIMKTRAFIVSALAKHEVELTLKKRLVAFEPVAYKMDPTV